MFPLSCTCLPSIEELSRSFQYTKKLNTSDNHMDLSLYPEKGLSISASKRMASILAPCKPCQSHLLIRIHLQSPSSLSDHDLSKNASKTGYRPHNRESLLPKTYFLI